MNGDEHTRLLQEIVEAVKENTAATAAFRTKVLELDAGSRKVAEEHYRLAVNYMAHWKRWAVTLIWVYGLLGTALGCIAAYIAYRLAGATIITV